MVYVAFLRAINVGGRAVVKMDALRDAFTDAGCRNVQTLIASGNVLFDAPATGRVALATRICQRLEALIGKDPGMFIRTKGEIASIIAVDPFRTLVRQPGAKPYVAFLGDKPSRVPRLPWRSEKEAIEAVAIVGRDVCVVSRAKNDGSYGFPNGVVEKAFGVAATTRNWNTVTRIATIASASRDPD